MNELIPGNNDLRIVMTGSELVEIILLALLRPESPAAEKGD